MAVDDPGDDVGQIKVRIDADWFAGLDQGGDDSPVLVAAIKPAKSAFFRFSAMGRMVRSATLESISIRPSPRKREKPSQRDKA